MDKTSVNSGYKGLTQEEVNERIAAGKINTSPNPRTKTCGQIIFDNTCTLFNVLNLVLAILVIAVGSYKNALFINIIVINTVIGIVQEIRAKLTVEKISLVTEPKATVIRDGKTQDIPVDHIVLDEHICLKTGKQIPSDGVVLLGDLEINEALLTGEADPILKKVGDPVLSGSFVVAGTGEIKVTRVGADNYANQLASEVKRINKPHSDIMNALGSITKFVSIIILPVGLLLLGQAIAIQGRSLQMRVTSTVAALVGMIPEGLVLLTSVALAVGVVRLSRCQTLVQELYCIETLARVDTLCLDKTGTITQGTMELKSIDAVEDCKMVTQVLRAMVASLKDDNPTFMAIRQSIRGKSQPWTVRQQIPFSSARKYSGVTFEEGGTYILGAPEFILRDEYKKIKERVEAHAQKGYRVLALCHSDEPFGEAGALPPHIAVAALLVLGDIIRPEAKDTLSYFSSQNVAIKVISGDNPVTVSEVAHRAGLSDYANYVDAATLTDEAALCAAANVYSVFGRVTPEQKRVLINALKDSGHTVAMTGDGVNDILALKDADCSIAMASGSEATRQMAQLVLLDSNFANLTQVLSEGRRVINNITRAASLFLVKTLFSLLLSLVVILSNKYYPFVPIQLTLISALTIAIPSFFLALEPNSARVEGSFLTNVLQKALPGALTNVVAIIAVIFMGGKLSLTADQISTVACILCGTTGLVILYAVCQPMDVGRVLLFTAMVFVFVFALFFFPGFFSIIPMDEMTGSMVLMVIPMMALTYPVLLVMRRLVMGCGALLPKKIKKRL